MNPDAIRKLLEFIGGPISGIGGIIGYLAGADAQQNCMNLNLSNQGDCPDPATWAAIGAGPGAFYLFYKVFFGGEN